MTAKTSELEKAQKKILGLVIGEYPQVYLVGGTAISLLYHHRVSEDLDFFTQTYSAKLHKGIAGFIGKKTGLRIVLVDEEKRKRYVQMAVYECHVAKNLILKIDIVKDPDRALQPRQQNGIASMEDIYYRKMRAIIGWKAGQSDTGRMLPGGRQKTKDLYDVFFLSSNVQLLSSWFPTHFNLNDYQRLTAWYLAIPKQSAMTELLELIHNCDTRRVFKHLDDEILVKLNKAYSGI